MKSSIATAGLLFLAACGGEAPDADSDRDTVGGEIAEGYQQQLDEAAAVEESLGTARERRDAAAEDAEGAGRE